MTHGEKDGPGFDVDTLADVQQAHHGWYARQIQALSKQGEARRGTGGREEAHRCY